MVRTMIGPDSTGAGCIKMMKSDADDPRTTPDNERWKFLYNSKFSITMNLADMQRVNQITRPGLNDSGVMLYYPPGSNNSNFVYAETSGGGQSHWCYKKEHFPTLRYDVPLFDIKAKKGEGSNRYNQQMVFWFDSYDYYNGQGGFYVAGNYQQLGWVTGTNSSFFNNIFGAWASGIIIQITRFDTIDGFNRFLSRDRTLVVWNLPGNNAPVDEAPALAPNGSKTIKISSSEFKAARPGYPVDTATPAQIAFDIGAKLPVKVIRSADPPGWADIVIDSRWPQVQILAQGWINTVAGNGVAYDIPFDGTGMFPMVKYITTHGAGRGGSAAPGGLNQLITSWTNVYRLPFIKRLKYTAPGNQSHAGESTYCELTQNNARFWTFAGNVGDYYNRRDSPGSWRTEGATPPLGIRYYVFGIPA